MPEDTGYQILSYYMAFKILVKISIYNKAVLIIIYSLNKGRDENAFNEGRPTADMKAKWLSVNENDFMKAFSSLYFNFAFMSVCRPMKAKWKCGYETYPVGHSVHLYM